MPRLPPDPQGTRQCQYIDGGGPGPLQNPCAFFSGRPGGQHIVDDHGPLTGEAATSPDGKGAAHVALARGWPEMTLRRRASSAHQPIRRNRRTAGRVYALSQQDRLIVAALKEPGPMQWHRHEEIGVCQDLAADTMHPTPKGAGRMSSVAVFQSENKSTAVVVVSQYRARPIPAPPLARTRAAQRLLAHRMGKGQPATNAPWRAKKCNASPAPAAQRVRLAECCAAGKTAWRQHPVDDGASDLQQPTGSPAGKGCRRLH
jgi:hypothetical protein